MKFSQRGIIRQPLFIVIALLALVAAGLPSLLGAAGAAGGGLSGVALKDAQSGAAIGTFRWLLTVDDSGDPRDNRGCTPSEADYPDNCRWPSLHEMAGGTLGTDTGTNVVAQGDQSYFGAGRTAPLRAGTHYLLSVKADGYKIDGAHFAADGAGDAGTVAVLAQPFSVLKLATLRGQVFNDMASTNGEFDIPDEQPNGSAQRPWMAGFEGHISDVLAAVTTDWYGNPVCTTYAKANADGSRSTAAASWGNLDNRWAVDEVWLGADGKPGVVAVGGKCLSDRYGDIAFPYLGPNRYGFSATQPAGNAWIQTSTLEGGHDWDTWVQEGATGFDTEKLLNGEPVPQTQLGFVPAAGVKTTSAAGGTLSGRAWSVHSYWPPVGGNAFADGGGARLDAPVSKVWIALSDLRLGDRTVWVGQGNADGSFSIPNLPPSDYSVAFWDQDQNLILNLQQTTVRAGKTADLGTVGLYHWFADFQGSVFLDTNGNGKRDPSESGIPSFPVSFKQRDNSMVDQGQKSSITDATGRWHLQQAYPLGKWTAIEAFDTRFKTTGYSYQADNDPTQHTVASSNVDISVLPLIGLGGRLDIGVQRYSGAENGGIVGEVAYDTTRNELDARFAAIESYEGGIPGMPVSLDRPAPCAPAGYGAPADGSRCSAAVGSPDGGYVLDVDGSYRRGEHLNDYTTEQWHQPRGCTAYDVNKAPLTLPWMASGPGAATARCIESPDLGTQIANETVDAAGHQASPGQELNGNYGFTTDAAGNRLTPGDYLVSVTSPTSADGKAAYTVRKEEDVNVFTGDHYQPQIPPPSCAGAEHTVTVTNPDFLAAGGSPYEGKQMPLCDRKLVQVTNGVSVAPSFTFFTDVPAPGRFWGVVVDDLNISNDPSSILYGEQMGVAYLPVGIYDAQSRLVHTTETDKNGIYEMTLPSTGTYNCPLPAGPCPNVYRFVANDPGPVGHPNPSFNPAYRTVATEFALWPNVTLPSDLAPIPIGTMVSGGNGGVLRQAACLSAPGTPQVFAVDQPVLSGTGDKPLNIDGTGFGSTPTVTLTRQGAAAGTTLARSANDGHITATVPGSLPAGAYQLDVTSGGKTSTSGITIHKLGSGYNPTVYEVGPGKAFPTIQAAVTAAGNDRSALVVVRPGAPAQWNPTGAYYENLIVHSDLKLQGVGPGGIRSDGSYVAGSVLNAGGFAGNAAAWRTRLAGLTWAGEQTAYEGAGISYYVPTGWIAGSPAGWLPSVDGLTITGANPLDVPNTLGGTGAGANRNIALSQGGGIFVNAYASSLQISNDALAGNGGAYGGAIRLGTPFDGADSAGNTDLRISHNRITNNGGTALAGGVAIFQGAGNYRVDHNEVCGNFSAEYGGGISHYGLSDAGMIDHNLIRDNASYDEGGGILIAGELPADPTTPSTGAGRVTVDANTILSNISNDDGGGIRYLMARQDQTATNNMIVNNVSSHEGGGVALDDTPVLSFAGNTVAKNITTATASTSNGQPAPAGLSSTGNSSILQKVITNKRAKLYDFSNPTMTGNIFYDNRAGSWDGAKEIGLDAAASNVWDLGVADGTCAKNGVPYSPCFDAVTYTAVSKANPNDLNPATKGNTLLTAPPGFLATYDTQLQFSPFKNNPNFVGATLVFLAVPDTVQGDYHLGATPNAALLNKVPFTQTPASQNVMPRLDIDSQTRPASPATRADMGADEVTP